MTSRHWCSGWPVLFATFGLLPPGNMTGRIRLANVRYPAAK
jgi:hypothetical protein